MSVSFTVLVSVIPYRKSCVIPADILLTFPAKAVARLGGRKPQLPGLRRMSSLVDFKGVAKRAVTRWMTVPSTFSDVLGAGFRGWTVDSDREVRAVK